MDEQNQAPRFSRPKVQGNWTCASCGTAITELPFEPRPGSQVHCNECWRNRPRAPRNFQR